MKCRRLLEQVTENRRDSVKIRKTVVQVRKHGHQLRHGARVQGCVRVLLGLREDAIGTGAGLRVQWRLLARNTVTSDINPRVVITDFLHLFTSKVLCFRRRGGRVQCDATEFGIWKPAGSVKRAVPSRLKYTSV